ncbi:flagellar basal body-associated FliL family protein [Photobacterium sp. SDRW27]|uniref:flagellar basal body-associated FliL family protein n=1 Tax=Photobacterium obscurum TaxID=2829490 RepID=UPI002242FE96|nr:flagellar basal body-associated FliL family protein [Photobacterium obscurum]MCW8330681.1 flagellar basal body-associated FliL family protein [Photobacterium obscurum]
MTDETTEKKSKLPLIIAAVVLVVALAGGGGWWYFQQQAKQQVVAEVAESVPVAALVKKPVFLPLTKFVVSVPGDDRLHYLMLEASLMSYDQDQLDTVQEYMPVVRNAVITLLSELHYSDLTQSGVMKPLQAALRDAIQSVMNDMASSKGIDQVLITKMVIQ